jgi:competence protein ComFC
MKLLSKKIKDGFFSLFFPEPCAGCGRHIKDFAHECLCPECFETIKKPRGELCGICLKPIKPGAGGECIECREYKKHFELIAAGGVYEGALKELVHRMKFYGRKNGAKTAAEIMMGAAGDDFFAWPDAITCVPLSRGSLAERGYNQSEAVARILSKKYGMPFVKMIKKIKETEPQNKLERKDRINNLKGAFKASGCKGLNVLVVDDVYTTGATMNESAKALLTAEASAVRGIVAARSV